MRKSMLTPGKQHNFRVSADATWTDAFNRIADKNKWSSNKTMNILIHSALNMNDMTDESITVEITPQEFDFLRRMRQSPEELIIVPEAKPAKKAQPVVRETVVEPDPEPEPETTVEEEIAVSEKTPEQDAKRNEVLEKARRHMRASQI